MGEHFLQTHPVQGHLDPGVLVHARLHLHPGVFSIELHTRTVYISFRATHTVRSPCEIITRDYRVIWAHTVLEKSLIQYLVRTRDYEMTTYLYIPYIDFWNTSTAWSYKSIQNNLCIVFGSRYKT